MEEISAFRRQLETHRPADWETLPDFPLYMDQVLSYMERQTIRLDESDALTASMVNNYTKNALVPRAEGKKYNRDHLAYLTFVCILKQVMSVRDMDLLAAANGPGSFTGLRIGVSALKGLAWALEKPCCGVSTLAAMARNLAHMEGLIICAMDARRSQVYNALFLAHDGVLTRQCPDRAIGLAELAEEIKNRPEPKFVVGDGAGLCYNHLLEQDIPCRMAPPQLVMQNAVGVALAAEEMAAAGQVTTARDLVPVYLRLSQAERERLARGLKITLD